MQIKPNRTLLKGHVRSVTPAPDGWGADVEFAVSEAGATDGLPDFLQAEPGEIRTLFAAEPDGLRPGVAYAVTATVRGGPGGERIVVESAKAETR